MFVGSPVLNDGFGVTYVLVLLSSVLPLFGSFGVYGFEFWLVGSVSFFSSSGLVVVVPELVFVLVLVLVYVFVLESVDEPELVLVVLLPELEFVFVFVEVCVLVLVFVCC